MKYEKYIYEWNFVDIVESRYFTFVDRTSVLLRVALTLRNKMRDFFYRFGRYVIN